MRETGQCSRADLTRLSGVTAATMSRLLESLLVAGIIEEEIKSPEGKGRPSKLYKLASGTLKVIGIIIDVKMVKFFCGAIDGKIDNEALFEFKTPETYKALLNTISKVIKEINGNPSKKYIGIGVCIQGLINLKNETIALVPNLHFLDGQSLGKDLEDATGIRTNLFHDSGTLCFAEQFYGNASDINDFAIVDITTGMGMGAIVSGNYLSGNNGFGGELGHVTIDPDGPLCGCGKKGCFQMLAGDRALANKVSDKYGRKFRLFDVMEEYEKGNIEISDELELNIQYLALAVAMVINIFNPAVVFIHSKLLDIDNDLMEKLISKTRKYTLSPSSKECEIMRTTGNKMLGTLAGVIDDFFDNFVPKLTSK